MGSRGGIVWPWQISVYMPSLGSLGLILLPWQISVYRPKVWVLVGELCGRGRSLFIGIEFGFSCGNCVAVADLCLYA